MKKPTEKMINTVEFIIYWIVDVEKPNLEDFYDVSRFIGKHLEYAKYVKEDWESGRCYVAIPYDENDEVKVNIGKKYSPPHNGQHRYYADDIETYHNGVWVSKLKNPDRYNGYTFKK